ncbi:MAG: 3-dehydroshikimate dehydratase, partial [Bacteroidota bacterium]
GKCQATNGQCTLMAALEEANARPASYRDSLLTISFNVPSGSEFNLSGPASHVFYKTVIDGWTNAGSSPNTLSFNEGDDAHHTVKIDFNGFEAFELNYPHSGLRGLQIKEAGVTILADSCFVEGCYIMTDGESAHTFTSNAVYIEGASGTRIGGPDPEQHNVFLHGIRAQSCDQLMVSHTRFGCTSDGNAMLENEGGVALTLMDCTNASVSNCQMSGGYNRAVDLVNSTENLISDCLIGLNAAGNNNMGLYNAGIYFDGNSNNNSVDGCIFGATECGVAHILMEDGASNNTITSSVFGASADLLPFENPDQTALAGILIGENCSGNSIGNGTFTGGNNFLYLPNAGVALQSNAGNGNLVSKNSFVNNGGLAIDLNFDNWTSENDSNDADEGPNNAMNYPEPISILISEEMVELTYSFHGTPLTDVTIQLYGSSQCDDSGFGEGERYLDEQFTTTNQNGDATVSFSVPNDFPFYSALAIDSWSGDTGEFGPCSGEMSPQPTVSYSISETSLTVQTGQSTNAWLNFENIGFGHLEWSLYTDEAWLMADLENGTVAPGDSHGQYITLQAESLPVGTYYGAIYVSTNDPDNAEFTIDIILEVTPVMGGSFVAASTEIGITLTTNSSTTVSIQFTNDGEASTTWIASMPPGNSWVMPPSPNNGTLGAGQTGMLNLQFNANGLTPGTYSSELVFNTNATDNAFVLIPITLTVTQGTGNAAIVVTPENIGITLNNAESASQEVMIQNIGNASLNWNIVMPANTPWLTLQGANSGSVPGMGMATTLLSINAVGLSPGSYNATVMINSNATNSGPVLLAIALEVTQAQSGNALIAVTPPSTSYELFGGESILHAFNISNTGNNNLMWTISTAPEVSWITLPESTSGLLGQNQMSIYNILIDATSVSPGTHSAQLIIESNASNYPTLVIPIELEVLEPIATIQSAPTAILCPGASFNVDYEILGELDASNTCTIELSNSAGDFSNPQIIGSFSAISGSGSQPATLPDVMSEGSNYRLRLTSSQPAMVYEPSSFTLNIAGSVNVSITPTDVLCVNESVELLATPSGGWWSGGSVEGNTFASSEAGTHTLTYQVNSQGCAFSSETTITVAALPVVYMDAPSQLCENDESWNLNVSPTGGLLEGIGIEDGYFIPTGLGGQTADLSYLYIDANGCSASVSTSIEVVETPTFTLDVPDFFCNNDLAVDPEYSNLNGGQYTIDGTLTSVLDPSILAVGEHEMNYYVTVNGCTGVNSDVFEIMAAPETPVITFDGEWLQVTNATNSITWYLDNAAVGSGATFLPLESGFYTASANNGMCESTSDPLFIEITSVDSFSSTAVLIYPIPFTGYMNVMVGELPVDEVQLYDMGGRLVAQWNQPTIVSGTLRLGDQLAALPAGQYSLLITGSNGLIRKVVQK